MKTIGRKSEIKVLRAALVSDKPEMVALVGRRRVGKTYLVKKIYEGDIDFELTGLQYGTKAEQLQNYAIAMGSYFPKHEIAQRPTSWLEAFHLLSKALAQKPKKGKKVVFLDELPWLGTKRSDFIKGLGWFWNTWASQESVVVVICGSAASWMIDKVINDKGGLHNRITRLISLQPFSLAETRLFLAAKKIKLSEYQIIQLYMTMGGIPMYLDQVQSGRSAVQNIQDICFSPVGYLTKEFDRLFASLFDNYNNHVSIIRALSKKRGGMSRQDIIDNTRFTNGGMLSGILDELEQSGFIDIYGNYGNKTKDSIYRLTDPYSLFYLTFIEPLGPNASIDFTRLSDLPKWKSWSGYAFENVCLKHAKQIKKALGIQGIATSLSTFWSRPKDELPGTQIDLLIDRNDQSINLCEIKYSVDDYVISKKDVDNIAIKKRVFKYHSKTKKHLFTTLISNYDVVNNSNRVNYVDQVVTSKDLFSD